MNNKKLPITQPSWKMFAPYGKTIKGFLIVSAIIVATILLVQLFLQIGRG